MNDNERRKHCRVESGFRVRFSTLDDLVTSYTKNISKGGLFIKTEKKLPLNTVVRVVFTLPEAGGDIACLAKVVRSVPFDDEKMEYSQGIAVEFMEVSEEILAKIETFISKTLAQKDDNPLKFEQSLKILVVDDDRSYREQAAAALRLVGHDVTTAEDGIQALGLCLKHPPDLILSDVQMPRMDGWNLLRTIRSRQNLSATLFVFQTTLGGEKERLKGYQLGVDDYLSKPYTPEELVLRIERLFQRSIAPDNTTHKALRGDLDQVSLPTVLSMLELERKTGVVIIIGPVICSLFIKEGRPMAIEMENSPPDAEQMALVTQLFGWTEGQFEFVPQDETTEDLLKCSMQGLMMEAARLSDEAFR